AADKIAHSRGFPEEIQDPVVVLDLDHQIARVELAFLDHAFAAAHLGDFFHRDDDLAEEILQAFDLDAAFDGFLDGFFPPALHLDHVPLLVIRHGRCGRRLRGHTLLRFFAGAEVGSFFSHADTFYHGYHGVFSDALSCSARTSTR